MAIFHCSIKNFNRRSGAGNICSAAAYRSGERLTSIDDDKIKYPHRSKNDIEYSGLLNNPYGSRQELWNEVEKKDNRKNSNLAREVMIAIPKELDSEQRKQLITEYSGELVNRYNVAVDYSIHKPNDDNDNFHAHVLFTTREIIDNELDKKTRVLDQKQTGSKEFEYIRNTWADNANKTLEKYGFTERISAEKSENETKCIHHGYSSELKQENEDRKKAIKMESEIKEELKLLEQEKKEILNRIKEKELELYKIENEHDRKTDQEAEDKQEDPSEQQENESIEKETGHSIEFFETLLEKRFENEKNELMQERESTLDNKYSEMTELNKERSRLGNEFENKNIFYKIFNKKSHEKEIKELDKKLEEKKEDIHKTEDKFDDKINKQINDFSKEKKYIESGQQLKDFQKLLDNIDREKKLEKTSVLDKATEQAMERLDNNPQQELDRSLHR